MLKKIKGLLNKIDSRKWKIILATFVSFLTIISMLDSSRRLISVVWIFDGIAISTFLFIVAFIAGLIVIKALFRIAAGLSLLIYLAKSYCEIPIRSVSGDSALKSLLLMGFLYLTFYFLHSIWKSSKKYLDGFKKGNKEDLFWKILTIIIFIVFTGIFVLEVYQVTVPILSNLCIWQ